VNQEFTDYYKVLGIPPSATNEKVKEAYRKLALAYHPDVGGSVKKMSEINEAYSILSDQMLRANYDNIYENYHSSYQVNNIDEIQRMNQLVQILVVAKKAASESMYRGLAWLIIGIIVTVVSYFATSADGHYFVATGAILFGGYQFVRGLHYYFNPHILIKNNIGQASYQKAFSGLPLKTSWKAAWITVGLILVGLIGVSVYQVARGCGPDNNYQCAPSTQGY